MCYESGDEFSYEVCKKYNYLAWLNKCDKISTYFWKYLYNSVKYCNNL